MHKNISKSILEKSRKKLILISICFLSILLFNIIPFNQFSKVDTINNDDKRNLENINHSIESSNGGSILFEGVESPLNITDNGNLVERNQQITLLNQETLNLEYNLDDVHDWKAEKIENSIKNIQDKRNWINNSGFLSPTIYRVYGEWNTTHPYQSDHNLNINWNNPSFDHIIAASGVNAKYIRVHFTKVEFELYTGEHDYLYICNGSNDIYYANSTGDTDFYSPWVHGDTIKLIYSSDSAVEYFGYYIDFYEYVNSTSNLDINSNEWGFSYKNVIGTDGRDDGFNYHGVADAKNSTAMFVALYGAYDPATSNSFDYDTGAFSEISQNFTIPSGPVLEAYLSFDYYCQYALPTNDHYLYVKLNDQKIFSKGMLDISELGRREWLSSGKLYTDAWDNLTSIFNENIHQQQFNISLGFMVGAGYLYSGVTDEGLMNNIYFDNVSLVVTTKANSTQNGINLQINSDPFEDKDTWGYSNITLTGLWDSNPIILTLNSSSPHLTFEMNTTVYGSREVVTNINQQGTEGVSYQILSNGTIYWEFYHNLYTPADYSDNNFIVEKPKEWNFLDVKDSTLQNVPFEMGNLNDYYLKVNKTYAIFPGWWYFKATSPNYLNSSNTLLNKQGQWVDNINFSTGESTQISTQLNYSSWVPKDAGEINLTVYHPNGTIFFTESKTPNEGNVTFSQISFSSFNTVGGTYEYTLFWSNGTALGGFQSSFVVSHQSSLSLLKPDDAKLDLTTDAFVGDIIPLRVHFKDYENNKDIAGAIVSYNWSDGLEYFSDEGLGLYEANLDTSLLSNGIYEIFINTSKLGFKKDNITLQINLLEETDLLRLDSAYYVEMHDNSTVKYVYTNSTGGGISGASVDINIDNEYYSIADLLDGNYTIEFDTHYINTLGIYQIEINFTKPSYESQYAIFQFEVIEQSVDISVYINSQLIQENYLIEAMFKGKINVSVRAFAEIDEIYLSGGNITWNSDNFNKEIIEGGNSWFNDTIPLSSSNFSSGLNSVYIRFEQENYKIKNFGFQILISEQTVNISTFINGQEIDRNIILELTFKEQINISARAYANSEKIYLSGANITFNSDNYNKDLEETVFPWYNISIDISSSNFSSGINYVYLKFQLENYTNEFFSFQLLISEQTVNVSTFVNGQEIERNTILELTFKEQIDLSARVYANSEKIFLSGVNFTFISDNYYKNLEETIFPWYNTSIDISNSYFISGVNYVYLKFELENYTSDIFSFQLLIKAQKLNLTVLIDSVKISENHLLEFNFNDEFSISALSYALAEEIYLVDGLMTFIATDYEKNCTGFETYWYNTSITCSPNTFSLGVNYVYLRFQKENYSTTVFSFQILMDQIEINIDPVNFEDSINKEIGETFNISINLLDPKTNIPIEKASVSYLWDYGLGEMNETTPGVYQAFIDLPENLLGTYRFNLIITPEDSIYQTSQYSFLVVISEPIVDEPNFPNYLLWIIIGVLFTIVSILGFLSYRTYVYLPIRRKKEAELISRTQRFRDLNNIQAIVIIHRFSGIPIYSRSYSILEKHKKELFSGFIQAITMIGEEFSEEDEVKSESESKEEAYGVEKMMELDFKQFYCLIADIEDLRAVFILKNRSSERLKSQVSHLILALNLKLSKELEDWDGSLDDFEILVPEILNEYFELYYKDSFKLASDINLITLKKEKNLTKMEMRVINVIQSMSGDNVITNLNNIVELVHEENKNLIIEAIESLIKQKIIIPLNH